MPFSDADLITRSLLQEDQNAFGELVRRHQSPVRGFLLKLTRGDTHLVDDLAQQVFIRAWQSLRSYRGEGKFSTWLFTIAYNEFRMALRKRKELAFEELDELPTAPAQAATNEQSNLRLDLAEAMKTLTSAERAAIVLCCQNGLSHKEAARVLGCPVGTVKTHVLRGREKLRKKLKL